MSFKRGDRVAWPCTGIGSCGLYSFGSVTEVTENWVKVKFDTDDVYRYFTHTGQHFSNGPLLLYSPGMENEKSEWKRLNQIRNAPDTVAGRDGWPNE